MDFQLEILNKNRVAILNLIQGFTIDQLNKVPEGFNNSLAWNVAHLVVTQQLLCYNLAKLPMHINADLVERFRKGTAPTSGISNTDFAVIKDLFVSLPMQLKTDLETGIFKPFDGYTTSLNVTLTDIESVISFNNFHEGIHLGSIMALRKLV